MPGAGRPEKGSAKRTYFNISIDRDLKDAFKKKYGYKASSVIVEFIKRDLLNSKNIKMKYFVTINSATQDDNFGKHGASPNFIEMKTAWVFEANSEAEIRNSFFTIKNDLVEFNSREEADKYAKANADNRFIEFAPYDLVSKTK